MSSRLVELGLMYGQLSIISFGGGNAIIEEMQREVVGSHHWMNAQEFGALYALAQAAPGPNMMIVVLIGWRIAGGWGALVSALAGLGPSSIIAGMISRLWTRWEGQGLRVWAQAALMPITIGLVAASAATLVHATAQGLVLGVIVATAVLGTVWQRIHPLILLSAGGLAGLVLL